LLIERPAQRIELLALLIAFTLLLAILGHHVLRQLLSAVAQLVERALLRLPGALELTARQIVARLAHRLAGIVQPAGDLHAVPAQALDDLIELRDGAVDVVRLGVVVQRDLRARTVERRVGFDGVLELTAGPRAPFGETAFSLKVDSWCMMA